MSARQFEMMICDQTKALARCIPLDNARIYSGIYNTGEKGFLKGHTDPDIR